MATVKEMRDRIANVKSTQKITKALQMVAAAKLRKAQEAAQHARPFAQKMSAVISNLAAGMEGNPSAPAAGGAAPNTTGSGMSSPNTSVPNANINPGTGQKYDPSNLNDLNNPNNPATRR